MHDRHGQPLAVGDTILIEATITSISDPGTPFCNVVVTTDVPLNGSAYFIQLNAGQVTKVLHLRD